jgi:hypothetical protein
MNSISQVYRQACRQIDLPAAEKRLFLKLLREISVNAIQRQKAWNIKEDFIALWFISAGRFPELAASPYNKVISEWVAGQLPFELNEEEKSLLWS